MASLARASLALLISVAAAMLPAAVSTGTYGYYPGHGGYYGKHPVFLNQPDLTQAPGPAAWPQAPGYDTQNGGDSGSNPWTLPVQSTPTCSVYTRATSTGGNAGHLTLVVSDTSDVNFEAPYTLVFGNPQLASVTAYNTNNSPSTVTLGEGGIVTSVVTSIIPAHSTNTLEYDLTSNAPDATYNPSGAFNPVWVSLNGIACGIVTGF